MLAPLARASCGLAGGDLGQGCWQAVLACSDAEVSRTASHQRALPRFLRDTSRPSGQQSAKPPARSIPVDRPILRQPSGFAPDPFTLKRAGPFAVDIERQAAWRANSGPAATAPRLRKPTWGGVPALASNLCVFRQAGLNGTAVRRTCQVRDFETKRPVLGPGPPRSSVPQDTKTFSLAPLSAFHV